jgi:hypothetical protein
MEVAGTQLIQVAANLVSSSTNEDLAVNLASVELLSNDCEIDILPERTASIDGLHISSSSETIMTPFHHDRQLKSPPLIDEIELLTSLVFVSEEPHPYIASTFPEHQQLTTSHFIPPNKQHRLKNHNLCAKLLQIVQENHESLVNLIQECFEDGDESLLNEFTRGGDYYEL